MTQSPHPAPAGPVGAGPAARSTARRGIGRRHLLAGAGIAGTALTAAACSGGQSIGGAEAPPAAAEPFSGTYDGPDVTITFWNGFTGGDGPYMKQLVAEFTEANPAITVEQSSLEWPDLYSKVVTATDAGSGPDVAAMHLDQLASFAARGTIVPLDDLTESLGLTASDFTPAVWQGGVFQDRRYGIPLDMFTIAQYWSTPMLASAGLESGPATAEEFAAATTALQGAGVAAPFWISPDNWQIFVSLLGQFGGSLYSEDLTTVTFGDEAGVKALTWMRDLVESGVSPSDATDLATAFKNGSSAIIHELLWLINDIEDTADGMEYGIGPFPMIGDAPGVFANSHHFALTKQADADEDRGQAARMFISWMSENSATWAGSGNIPARASARQDVVFTEGRQAPLAADDVLESFLFLQQVPGSREIAADSYQRAVSRAVLGEEEPEAALAAAVTTAQEMLDRNRELYGI
ncbi:ABC transporter substrate-binding protein [Brachybacterium phenoliresistens]|uniref:ABC transporter substrate-binding protein n=1 Tax=Brachybacterium phenoliresistens TaxID=396014 RepID=Z9JX15_9MICO|nr:extracellular solute-binding protein [Brachybacterium phenoliresistens]EWS82332.1 ABC transporter substrate-binding protein [Brachybacterium phenoliresistens]